MILFPLKTKFKKYHKRNKQLVKTEFLYNQPLLGFAGLKSQKSFRLNSIQIEAARKLISKNIKKLHKNKTKFKLCFFPDLSITKKPSGVRMGKGKGNVAFWCGLIKKGRIFIELSTYSISKFILFRILSLVCNKFPGLTIPVVR